MWSTLFIIDPLYTLPLLVGTLVALCSKVSKRQHRFLLTGLIISCCYLGWSWIAKIQVESQAAVALASDDLDQAPRFSVPTPFNTLLWRVVVKIDAGYLVGYYSLLDGENSITFTQYDSDDRVLADADDIAAIQQLRWFSQDFLKTEIDRNRLLMSDIRMGLEPDSYVFNFEVAKKSDSTWVAIEPRSFQTPRDMSRLQDVWYRIWDSSITP